MLHRLPLVFDLYFAEEEEEIEMLLEYYLQRLFLSFISTANTTHNLCWLRCSHSSLFCFCIIISLQHISNTTTSKFHL